jgi:cell division protein FtsW (lipid II flippase)
MRLPRTQRDLSWPLGWTAVALELAGILTSIYSSVVDHVGDTYNDPESWVIAVFLLMAGQGVAILTLCITPFMPTGRRGWGPALGAMGLWVGTLAFFVATSSNE